MQRSFVLAAWVLAALIVFVTLGPLADRPKFGHPQDERFLAFLVLGFCWAATYPVRLWRVFVGVAGAAVVLEAAQALAPGRDPHVADALAKIAGAATGVTMIAIARACGLFERALSTVQVAQVKRAQVAARR
jgi:hypothetical protein